MLKQKGQQDHFCKTGLRGRFGIFFFSTGGSSGIPVWISCYASADDAIRNQSNGCSLKSAEVKSQKLNCSSELLKSRYVRLAIDAILIAEGAERKEQLASWTADKKQINF
ncbi:hypothetical protein LXL04_017789 [Taraxacum kok-saghyz]